MTKRNTRYKNRKDMLMHYFGVSTNLLAMNMVLIDWVILFVMIAGLMLLAPFLMRYVKGVAGFLVAGRQLRLWLGVSTMEASGIGLFAIAKFSEQGFSNGYAYIWLQVIGACLIIPLFGIIGFGIQRFRLTGVQTLPQFYEMRYNKFVRYLAGLVLTVGSLLSIAVYPMIGSKFLMIFMGLPEQAVIFGLTFKTFHLVMFSIIFFSIFFSLVGGMVSVVVTQYVQAIVMAASLFLVTFLLIKKAGFGNMGEAIWQNYGNAGFNVFAKTDGKGYGLAWALLFGMSKVLERLSIPNQCQQIASGTTPKVVRRMQLVGTLIAVGRVLMFISWGVAIMAILGATIPEGAEKSQYIRTIIPEYIGGCMPRAMLGLTVGGLIFAFISTNTSYFLSTASLIVNDVISPLKRRPFSQKMHLTALRIALVGIGIL